MEQILLEKYPNCDYALVKREGAVQPYVVAYKPIYNEDGTVKSWSSGTYFTLLCDAGKYIAQKINKPENDDVYRELIETWVEDDETQFDTNEEKGICVLAYHFVHETGNIAISVGNSWKEIFDEYYADAIKSYLTEEPIEDQCYFDGEQIAFLKENLLD